MQYNTIQCSFEFGGGGSQRGSQSKKLKCSIIQTKQNTTAKYKRNKIQTWQKAKIPKYKQTKYKRTKCKLPKYKCNKIEMKKKYKKYKYKTKQITMKKIEFDLHSLT